VILYLDTSSLIKLYVAEAGSEEVRRLRRPARGSREGDGCGAGELTP
jgi:predicted nucleic acid-binding protein